MKKGDTAGSALVFGASRGIGKLVALHLAGKGFRLTAAARKRRGLEDLARECLSHGLPINTAAADIGEEAQVAGAFASHRKAFGGPPLVVVNTAAVQGPIGPVWEAPSQEWARAVRIDLIGAFFVTKAAVSAMLSAGKGAVIHFSGGGAAYARPNLSAYGAAKTGLLRLVETAAEELKLAGHKGIIVTAVAPGAVKTAMTEEILRSAEKAGAKERKDAQEVLRTGGTPPPLILKLMDFLCDFRTNGSFSGRLVHVREDYAAYAAKAGGAPEKDEGKLRRVPLRARDKII